MAPASFSFAELFLDSHENALVSFLVGPGGGAGGGDARPNFDGDSLVGGGDHGIAGTILLRDIVRELDLGFSWGSGTSFSSTAQPVSFRTQKLEIRSSDERGQTCLWEEERLLQYHRPN